MKANEIILGFGVLIGISLWLQYFGGRKFLNDTISGFKNQSNYTAQQPNGYRYY